MRTLLAFMLIAWSAIASAQVPDADVQTLAQEIVVRAYAPASGKAASVARFEKDFVASFVKDPNGAALAQRRPDVLALAVSAGKDEYGRQFDAVVVPEMITAVAAIYVSSFTAQELLGVREYYQTPQAQRFLSSFSVGGSEIEAASNDPVVAKYRGSAIGLKEEGLSSAIANAMVDVARSSAPRLMPIVNAKIEAVFKAAAAKPRSSQ